MRRTVRSPAAVEDPVPDADPVRGSTSIAVAVDDPVADAEPVRSITLNGGMTRPVDEEVPVPATVAVRSSVRGYDPTPEPDADPNACTAVTIAGGLNAAPVMTYAPCVGAAMKVASAVVSVSTPNFQNARNPASVPVVVYSSMPPVQPDGRVPSDWLSDDRTNWTAVRPLPTTDSGGNGSFAAV